jgi:hypothetical protein
VYIYVRSGILTQAFSTLPVIAVEPFSIVLVGNQIPAEYELHADTVVRGG